jgi:WD40 repeat protein
VQVRNSNFEIPRSLAPWIAVFAIFFGTWQFGRWLCSPTEYAPALELAYHPPETLETVQSLSFSPDGRYLVAGIYDLGRGPEHGIVKLWDLTTGDSPQELNLGDPFPGAITFSADGKQIIVGEGQWRNLERFSVGKGEYRDKGRIVMLEVPTLRELRTIDLKWSVYGLATSPDGKHLAAIGSGGADQIEAGIWSVATGQEERSLSFRGTPALVGLPGDPLRPIIYSHDGKKLLLSTTADSTPCIQVIDAVAGDLLRTWKFPNQEITWIDLSSDDQFLAATASRSASFRWEISADFADLQKLNDLPATPTQFLKDGRRLIHAIRGTRLPIFAETKSIDEDKVFTRFKSSGVDRNCAFALSADGQWFAIGDHLGHIDVWKIPPLSSGSGNPVRSAGSPAN